MTSEHYYLNYESLSLKEKETYYLYYRDSFLERTKNIINDFYILKKTQSTMFPSKFKYILDAPLTEKELSQILDSNPTLYFPLMRQRPGLYTSSMARNPCEKLPPKSDVWNKAYKKYQLDKIQVAIDSETPLPEIIDLPEIIRSDYLKIIMSQGLQVVEYLEKYAASILMLYPNYQHPETQKIMLDKYPHLIFHTQVPAADKIEFIKNNIHLLDNFIKKPPKNIELEVAQYCYWHIKEELSQCDVNTIAKFLVDAPIFIELVETKDLLSRRFQCDHLILNVAQHLVKVGGSYMKCEELAVPIEIVERDFIYEIPFMQVLYENNRLGYILAQDSVPTNIYASAALKKGRLDLLELVHIDYLLRLEVVQKNPELQIQLDKMKLDKTINGTDKSSKFKL